MLIHGEASLPPVTRVHPSAPMHGTPGEGGCEIPTRAKPSAAWFRTMQHLKLAGQVCHSTAPDALARWMHHHRPTRPAPRRTCPLLGPSIPDAVAAAMASQPRSCRAAGACATPAARHLPPHASTACTAARHRCTGVACTSAYRSILRHRIARRNHLVHDVFLESQFVNQRIVVHLPLPHAPDLFFNPMP